MPVPPEQRFQFVHNSIADILRCQCQRDEQRNLVEPRTLKILYSGYEISNNVIDRETLIELAQASDSALFDQSIDIHSTLRPLLCGLVHVCHENVAAASLLALNSLESAIRRRTGHSTGNAPLLKTMLQQLHDKQVEPILKCLLLPHDGLNLRNLLWHGFVPSLPRPWFSLIIVLIYHLENGQDQVSAQTFPVLRELRYEPSIRMLLEERVNDASILSIRTRIPPSHQNLFDLSIKWSKRYPACAAALLAIILEHCLRIEWCHCNNRPTSDCIAQPSAYYTTLDGHGQRHQHELLLHPYIQQCRERNAMVCHLGGGTIALLTDLFASSSGGPNIRAALAHGMWDAHIEEEVCCRMGSSNEIVDEKLQDMVQLMILAMHHITTKSPIQYKPLFSYTATTLRALSETLQYLERLESLQKSTELQQMVTHTTLEIVLDDDTLLQVSTVILRQSISRLPFGSTSVDWTCDDVFEEYESNIILSNCSAARMLLCELTVATESYCRMLEGARKDFAEDRVRSRRQRRSMRLVSMVDITLILYTFVARVALLDIESKFLVETSSIAPGMLLKAVERSRMCLSTFATYLPTNYERATKSFAEFAKGKATRAVSRAIRVEK